MREWNDLSNCRGGNFSGWLSHSVQLISSPNLSCQRPPWYCSQFSQREITAIFLILSRLKNMPPPHKWNNALWAWYAQPFKPFSWYRGVIFKNLFRTRAENVWMLCASLLYLRMCPKLVGPPHTILSIEQQSTSLQFHNKAHVDGTQSKGAY